MDRVLIERMVRHGFARRADTTVVDAAARTVAIQAQDHAAARLGVRSRATGVTGADVLAAVGDDRSVARTWLMRGTIHLVPAADVHWLVRLFGPVLRRKFRTRWTQLGLTEDFLDRTRAVLPTMLDGPPLTKAEIVDALAEHGVPVTMPDPQAPVHVLLDASTHGLVCRAGDRGREATFTRLDRWLPDVPAGPDGDDALAELARRWFAAFSPATAQDFAAWSGLPTGQALELIRDELTPCEVHGRPGFRLGTVDGDGAAHAVRLLAGFDNYLIGYQHRPFVADDRRAEVYVGGIIRPVVLHQGRVIGRWQLQRRRTDAVVLAQPFEPWARRVRDAVEAEVADIGRFLALPTTSTIAVP
ncbi:MAG: winged helix DNA-binding domain-containing protein [Jatrophihabitans sp.]|uniref:winged helix DNA-binding domain-containing protein n=1 Tax=Jatrophihabitans sp. TaxID=1932789 RepID=UPI003F808BC4